MNLVGLLSFFDEPEEDLAACIAALAEAGVSELVAVDGAYSLFPGGRPRSPSDQHAAVVLSCGLVGMGCTLHVPRTTWVGNEVEKRTFLFTAGLLVAEPGDWFWVQDADQVVVRHPEDLKERLASAVEDTAEVMFLDTVAARAKQLDWPERFPVRSLFRAQPIHLETNHVTYVAGDGTLLWGYETGDRSLAPALDLTESVLVEHRPDHRPHERQLGKLQYYAQRDQARVERGACSVCGDPAVKLVPANWRLTDIGPVADWLEACEKHVRRQEFRNRYDLERLGIDPDSMAVENRNGRAPAAR